MNALWRLLPVFADICLLRKPPHQVPADWGLVLKALTAYLALGLLASTTFLDGWQVPGYVLFDAALLIGFLRTLLNGFGVSERLAQSLLAWLGCGMIFTVLSLPVLWMQSLDNHVNTYLETLNLMLMLWNLAAISFIIQHSLELNRTKATLITLMYLFANLMLAKMFGF